MGASARTLYGWRGVACGSSAHEAANGRYGGSKNKAVTLARLQREFWNAQLEHIWRTVCGYKHRRRPKMDSVKRRKTSLTVYRCGVQSMGKIVQCRCFTNAGRRECRKALISGDGVRFSCNAKRWGETGEEFRESVRGGLEQLRV